MDDLVLRGMAKWPDVPAVYGWLRLDRRGNWLIKGESITNETVTAFIGRNYEHDSEGRWFFQNGPQRVFVMLDYTPLVYRVLKSDAGVLSLETHTGVPARSLTGAWIDENGAVLVETEQGLGVVHDHDLHNLVSAFIDANGNPLPEEALDDLMQMLQQGRAAPLWLKYGAADIKIDAVQSKDVPKRFGFADRPVARAGEAECA